MRSNPEFRLLWAGDAVSQLGNQLTVIALPLVAITTLQSSTLQIGLLTAAGYLAWLVIGLPAGAWVDRRRRRPVLVGADLGRAALLLSVPLAAATDVLTLWQLYFVALGTSVLTTVFDVAYPAYLPHLVQRDHLVTANARLQLNASVAYIAGPGIGGVLVQVLTAPITLLLDAASYLVSAVCLNRISKQEPAVPPKPERHLGREISEGLRFAWRQPIIRAIARSSAVFNFSFAGYQALIIVFLVREVGQSTASTGLLLAAGSVGGAVGALLVGPLSRRLGDARLIWAVPLVTMPAILLVPITYPGWGLAFFVVGAFVPAVGGVAFNVSVASFIQALTPQDMLGRVGGSIRVLTRGALPVGAATAAWLTTWLPVRGVLVLAAAGMTLAILSLLLSPIRRLTTLAEVQREEPMSRPST
ncbi:MFS transporter [Lentzea cavernae]|uniref:MFS transporter n=1 Tax=Lentzea cavernae TaxID=2020703 RepID=A0ABQ3M4E8_9PSEU|nr:MFS transporter [Lentzea cavernae]GHH32439.1 MFS transporter [Lentzea cavernae]